MEMMIKMERKNFAADKFTQDIGKPKEVWKSLKSLRLPSKRKLPTSICLIKDRNQFFDPETNAEIFKDFYPKLRK